MLSGKYDWDQSSGNMYMCHMTGPASSEEHRHHKLRSVRTCCYFKANKAFNKVFNISK